MNTDQGGPRYALSGDEEAKEGVSTANADRDRQQHTPTRDKERKWGVRTLNTMREHKSTHSLETRQRGVSAVNMDERGRKHALPEYKEAKGWPKQMREDRSTHFLKTRRQTAV